MATSPYSRKSSAPAAASSRPTPSTSGGRRIRHRSPSARPGGVFAIGAIWDEWSDPKTGDRRRSFAVVTTTPSEVMAPIHDRMPVILAAADWVAWLDPATPLKDARALVQPCPAEAMTAYRVGAATGRQHPSASLAGEPDDFRAMMANLPPIGSQPVPA